MTGTKGHPARWLDWLRGRGVRSVVPRLVGLAALVGVIALRAWDPAPMQIARLKAMDLYQQIEPRADAQRLVTIVDIDEASLAELGQWPWPRTRLAELVQALGRYGVVAVAFDMVFPEPDRMSPDRVAAALPQLDGTVAERLRGLPSNDAVFARTLANAPVVLGQVGLHAGGSDIEGAPRAPYGEAIGDPRPHLLRFEGLLRNVPELEAAAPAVGMINVETEIDGVVRRVPAMVNVQGELFPSLSLELMRLAIARSVTSQPGRELTVGIRTDAAGVDAIFFQELALGPDGAARSTGNTIRMPTDGRARWWVYFAPPAADRYVSAKEVLDGTAPAEQLRGRLVVVGTSAAGLHDIKTTPLGLSVPGAEVHAQIVEAVWSQTFLSRPNDAVVTELAAAAALGLLMIVLVPMLGAVRTLILGAVVSAATMAGAYYMFAEERLVYDVTFPLAAGLLVYAVLVYMSYIREEAQRRQVRSAFSRYISPAVMERVVEHPEDLRLGGQMRDLTILFCDIRGFTTISESFDAEGLTRLINRFLTPMTDVILRHDGTIDKYIGDCIMAFWNAPLDDPEHARHGCHAALDMMRRLETLNAELAVLAEQEGTPHPPIAIGIGLNTGECCVGNLGSEQRFDYSVLGDDVNLASRLEGQTKSYGVGIVIGENTQALAPGMGTLELDLIRVKGKARPVRMFALLRDEAGAADPAFREHQAGHAAMLAAYRAQDWDAAEARLDECAASAVGAELGALCDLYRARIAAFRRDPPPPDWDGVYIAEAK